MKELKITPFEMSWKKYLLEILASAEEMNVKFMSHHWKKWIETRQVHFLKNSRMKNGLEVKDLRFILENRRQE